MSDFEEITYEKIGMNDLEITEASIGEQESTLIDESVNTCMPHHATSIIVPSIIAVICGIGLILNLLVVFFIGVLREYKKSATNVYVLQLAIADTIFLLQLPFQITTMLTGIWNYGIAWCKLSESIKLMNYYASIMFLTIMSVDRSLAINFSTDKKVARLRSKTFVTSSLLWILAILSTIDILKYADVQNCSCQIFFPGETDFQQIMDELSGLSSAEYDDDYENNYGSGNSSTYDDYQHLFKDTGDSCSYNKPYVPQRFRIWLICNFVLAFLLPLLIICVSYGLIIRRIVRPTALGEKCQKSNKTRKRVTIMVTALVSGFIICWLPYHALHLARLGGVKMSAEVCDRLGSFTLILAYSNSALNPFFYLILGTKFQRRCGIAMRVLSSGFRLKTFSHSHDYTSGTAAQRRRSSGLSTSSKSCQKQNVIVSNGNEENLKNTNDLK